MHWKRIIAETEYQAKGMYDSEDVLFSLHEPNSTLVFHVLPYLAILRSNTEIPSVQHHKRDVHIYRKSACISIDISYGIRDSSLVRWTEELSPGSLPCCLLYQFPDLSEEIAVFADLCVASHCAEAAVRHDGIQVRRQSAEIADTGVEHLVTLLLEGAVFYAREIGGQGIPAENIGRHGLVKSTDRTDDIFCHGPLVRVKAAQKVPRLLKGADRAL